uniref:Uncharacterized protein n=1 Tax=Cacopsylla melanoneura TaxID=428564 RepID=A0A8D9BNG5_9HEMI
MFRTHFPSTCSLGDKTLQHHSGLGNEAPQHHSRLDDSSQHLLSYNVESLVSPDKRNTYTYLQSSQGGGFSDFAFNVQCSPHVILILESMSLKGGDQFQFSLDH